MSKSKRKLDSIETKCLELKKYNKEHGTHYSYGQYITLIRLGKIKLNRSK